VLSIDHFGVVKLEKNAK